MDPDRAASAGRRDGVALLGDQILVLDRAGRHFAARHARHVARPDAGGHDHDLAGDGALVGEHALDASPVSLGVTRTFSTMRTPLERAPLA